MSRICHAFVPWGKEIDPSKGLGASHIWWFHWASTMHCWRALERQKMNWLHCLVQCNFLSLLTDNACPLYIKKGQGMHGFGQLLSYACFVCPSKRFAILGYCSLLQIKASPWKSEVQLLIYCPWVTCLDRFIVVGVDSMYSSILLHNNMVWCERSMESMWIRFVS